MWKFNFLIVLCVGAISNFADAAVSHGAHHYGGLLTEEERKAMCKSPVSGPQWVFSQKNEDYGWGEQSHRALIVLALDNYSELPDNGEDASLLQHQLEVELTKALLRNKTQPMLVSDLALYIHALIITRKDPRNFHGLDLVKILKGRVDDQCYNRRTDDVNVFALLVLSDCGAINQNHFKKLEAILSSQGEGRKQKELKALALHALACAMDGSEVSSNYSSLVYSASAALAESQNPDGSFGNVYTTALSMQALIASQHKGWEKEAARQFLIRKRVENVNIVSTYYIERALKASEVKCFRSFYKIEPTSEDGLTTLKELRRLKKVSYVQFTLRTSKYPDIYFSATIHVPNNITFFDIMRLVAAEDDKFRFSWYLDESGQPAVYSISGIPNNAEESLYWRLIEESRETNSKKEHTQSPRLLYPTKGAHLIYTYTNAFKPAAEVY